MKASLPCPLASFVWVFGAVHRRRLLAQQVGNPALQTREIERFGEKVFGVHGHGAFGYFAGKRAHENDGDFFCGRLAAQDFADGQTVQIGQQNVEEDEIRSELPRLGERLYAVIGHDQFIAQPGESELHQLDKIPLVVHDQNARHHTGKLSRFRAKHHDGAVKAVSRNGNGTPITASA